MWPRPVILTAINTGLDTPKPRQTGGNYLMEKWMKKLNILKRNLYKCVSVRNNDISFPDPVHYCRLEFPE